MIQEIIQQLTKVPETFSNQLLHAVKTSSKVIIIGNGGSNAIASHIAVDYRKFLNKRVDVLTDSAMLTMLVNDYGADSAYYKFLEMNYEPNMLVILISSSGESQNVINALVWCNENYCKTVCLSGFRSENRFNSLAHYSEHAIIIYHVPSSSYGVVENVHQIFLHSIC